jgi:hypothetical protein
MASVSQKVPAASVVAYFDSRTWMVAKVSAAALVSAATGP